MTKTELFHSISIVVAQPHIRITYGLRLVCQEGTWVFYVYPGVIKA
jgi:hypothetical protein